MILDKRTEMAKAISVAAAAGTAVLGDVIDLTNVNAYDIGLSETLWMVLRVDTAIITGGAAGTIQFFVVSDALATLGGGTVAGSTLHATSPSIVTGASASGLAAAGSIIMAIELPAGANYERYLGVLYTVGTTTTTAGKVDAFITRDYARWIATADAVN